MKKQVIFVTLHCFSATGGIEKVNRMLAKVLYEYADNLNLPFCMISLHDDAKDHDDRYFPAANNYSFKGNKLAAIKKLLSFSRKESDILLSHVNLLPAGVLAAKVNTKNFLGLVSHGIEIWDQFSFLRKQAAKRVNKFICVSNFTADKLKKVNQIPAAKIAVINNALDPFLPAQSMVKKDSILLDKFDIAKNDIVLFALTRLKETERHKNYISVIESLQPVSDAIGKKIHYLLAGKATESEAAFIMEKATAAGVASQVHLAGFVADKDLPTYFALADAYVLPSRKEGFGITFIEALHFGLPVIAGNADGSVDALDGGRLGMLITPGDKMALQNALIEMLTNLSANIPSPDIVQEKFGYHRYKADWENLFADCKKSISNKQTFAAH